MYRGTLRRCVEALASIPMTERSIVRTILHLPKSKCYQLLTADEFATFANTTDVRDWRIVFRGSLDEAAHFVLSPQTSLLVTENGYPHLPDNQTPPLDEPPAPEDGDADDPASV